MIDFDKHVELNTVHKELFLEGVEFFVIDPSNISVVHICKVTVVTELASYGHANKQEFMNAEGVEGKVTQFFSDSIKVYQSIDECIILTFGVM